MTVSSVHQSISEFISEFRHSGTLWTGRGEGIIRQSAGLTIQVYNYNQLVASDGRRSELSLRCQSPHAPPASLSMTPSQTVVPHCEAQLG